MRKPPWLQKRVGFSKETFAVRNLIDTGGLNTVCKSARCPNLGECYSAGVATFMILGELCSRACRFCAVERGATVGIDPEEPERVAETAFLMKLSHVVITSVTRDDLPDGGAGVFAQTIKALRARLPDSTIEVLTPDFQGVDNSIDTVIDAEPDCFNHNIETVPSLYRKVRPQASYRRSLNLLEQVKKKSGADMKTKSGLMLGFGERIDEVLAVMNDLRSVGCDIVTIGQYLQPDRKSLEVTEYVPPETFDSLKEKGLALGFTVVNAGPYVRSSYHAGELFGENAKRERSHA